MELRVQDIFIQIGNEWLREWFEGKTVPYDFLDRVRTFYKECVTEDVKVEVELIDAWCEYADHTRLDMWAGCFDEDGDYVEVHSSSTDFQYLVGFSTGDDVWHQ